MTEFPRSKEAYDDFVNLGEPREEFLEAFELLCELQLAKESLLSEELFNSARAELLVAVSRIHRYAL